MPDAAHPMALVERQAVKALTALALTAVTVELLIALAPWGLGVRSSFWSELGIFVQISWRGAWMGVLSLWSICATPWRSSGGRLAVISLVAMAFAVGAESVSQGREQFWTLPYCGAIAVWILAARIFGWRLGHGEQASNQSRLRWSLLTIVVFVTFSAIVAGVAAAIWRSWLYERENHGGFLVGLIQFLLLAVMAATLVQTAFLLAALRWGWANYVLIFLGSLVVAWILGFRIRGEIAAIVLIAGFSLVSNGILATVVHYYGWGVFLDTPVWERKTKTTFIAPPKP